MEWETVVGLEVHVQLNTKSKIFSNASTEFGSAPNENANAVDLALPGTLPVVNREVIRKALILGMALNATINRYTIFDRKHYFYPDLPKGYQITQLRCPIIQAGELPIGKGEKTIRILQAHMEENAGKSVHDLFPEGTAVDFNRAGTPLIEVVSAPDLYSAHEAVTYAKELYRLVTWLGICNGDMSQGEFRADVNVSVRPMGEKRLGTRCEIKNLNSFKFIEEAIEYEARRQIDLLEEGGKIEQETRLFDANLGETRSMRTKEDAHDYRYFPDPDFYPLKITDQMMEEAKANMPELPREKQNRLVSDYGLSEYDASQVTASRLQAEFFEEATGLSQQPKLVANWMNGEIAFNLNKQAKDFSELPITARQLADLVTRVVDGTLSTRLAKQVFEVIWNEAIEVDAVIERENLKQIGDIATLDKIVEEVLQKHTKLVEEFRSGKQKALNALVGQVMKLTLGKADPVQVQQLMKEKLS
ncbi:MAG: Asp-tRNA(Asn)/Glu-tRNA(Gln) amidotransferase subunit GatB [Neisseriaceae bacterium]